MSLLMICEIIGHFVSTLASGDKYSLPNTENFLQPVQMQLSKDQIIFSEYLFPFLKSISIFDHFEKKKDTLIAYIFLKIQTANNVVM